MSAFVSVAAFERALAALPGPDRVAQADATARQATLTKPPGSLGRLEDLAVFVAGWQGVAAPRIEHGRVAVFAGNHGVVAHGVSAFPAAVTAEMVRNFRNGGAAINALAAAAGLDLVVVPLELDRPTADFTSAPAMTAEDCLAALNAGAAVVADGVDLLVLGEMGIGNSTAAAALCARSFGGSAADWVGPGTGVDAAGVARKGAVVETALACHAGAPHTAFETLRRVGGREIAAIAGAVVAARLAGVVVVLDGFICSAALAPIAALHPAIVDHCIAGHCSAEPGHVRLLARLGLTPLLDLGMRLGEASGGAVAAGVIRAALAAHREMATFAEAGISGA
ncbi:nicotinate-nucleotide--dimethylbenzimidazole phosphoribosyltransferase [Sphingomonas sp. PAMC 26605]|uniref:nicotinate-nucleotide--dimethylbenzimidazole phosphoribosyltransferase n=1 Tax=Sphingomonas sp. PAMC 26605 TaxID=1112214 RepID=UPI00026CCB17|nr:nicotinate-nucleotide--dimethylbenzimidazole phosphoribosyltransferase [Sphingomonas sp. PAMC 26605]